MSDYTLNVPLTVLVCPACGQHLWPSGSIELDGSPSFDEITAAVQLAIAEREEQTIEAHYAGRHRFRLWLWNKTGWKRVLG